MREQNEIYIEAFKEWLNEQELRREECSNSIITAEKIIKSNGKQIELNKDITNSAIDEFNAWAKKENVKEIEKVE